MQSIRRLAAIAAATTLLAAGAACGSDDPDVAASTTTSTAGPGAGGAPAAIVSLSPTATEVLFAIGAGDQVVAVDDQSDYPPEAPRTKLSGFTPNIEAIAGYEPDLVVFSTDAKGALGRDLRRLGIETLQQDAVSTLDEAYAQIRELGGVTGHAAEAAQLVADMQGDIDDLLDRVPAGSDGLTYYHELDPTLFSVTSATFIGDVYGLVGLDNIADAADAGPYPQLSAEYIIDADPDLIFLADNQCCDQTPESVAERPGWSGLSAVEHGGVVPVDEDLASRWGPRVVDFLRAVIDAVTSRVESAA